MDELFRRLGKTIFRWAPSAFWVALTCWYILTHIPQQQLPEEPLLNDKLVHCVGYFILGTLATLAYGRRRQFPINQLLGLSIFAAFDEFTQGYFQRSPSLADFFFDVCGIVLGIGAVCYFLRRTNKDHTQ